MGRIAVIYTDLKDPKRLTVDSIVPPAYINKYVNNTICLQIRTFYVTPNWKGQESSSKIEEAVKNIKEEKQLKEKTDSIAKDCDTKKVVVKVTIWQKIKGEILHYYHGFRLLGLDMKISAKLIWRILHGKELSRREHRLVSEITVVYYISP